MAASGLLASTTPVASEDLAAAALRTRAAGDLRTAIHELEQLVAVWPQRTDYEILLAETLSWDKRFPEAEAHYRHVLGTEPASRPAGLGLGRVLLWEGRYEEAQAAFDQLLKRDAADIDALEGRGTAEYWSGDTRAAARDFRMVLARDPERPLARRSLDEIRLAALAEDRISFDVVDDDQPYRLARGQVKSSAFSDPLTRWSVAAGTYRAQAPVFGTATMPFVRVGNESVLPRLHLTVTSSLGLVRYGDGVSRAVGELSVSRQLSKNARLVLRAERAELLATATALATHPSLTSYGAAWRRESTEGWMAAVDVATLAYFDDNRGLSAFGYGLAPLWNGGGTLVLCGASAAYRDARQSRFALAAISSVRAGDEFRYAYRGAYAPYWTPQDLREARVVMVVRTAVRSAALELHADGGIGWDRATAFGPAAGPGPLPLAIQSFDFQRRFHPFRLDLTASLPVTGALRAELGFEMASTAFYRAKSFHASLARQR
jgi:hypothetical protein